VKDLRAARPKKYSSVERPDATHVHTHDMRAKLFRKPAT
jgi:hypothetical protein